MGILAGNAGTIWRRRDFLVTNHSGVRPRTGMWNRLGAGISIGKERADETEQHQILFKKTL
jgi:hypothetical protein